MKNKLMMMLAGALAAMTVQAVDVAPPAPAPAASKPSGAAKIKFEKMVYDFGATSMVQMVVGTFAFQNDGDGELVLQRPSTSCGCTVASVKPETLKLKPGEKGEIGFTLSVGSARGPMEKHITVNSNDPQSPSIGLTIKANMQVLIDAAPLQVMLGEMPVGFATNVTLQIRRTDGKPLNLAKLDVSNPFITSKFVPVEGSTGTAVTVTLQIKPDGAPRHFYERVSAFVEGINYPVLTIPVFGQLMGDLRIQPEAVFWGIPDPQNWPGPRPDLMTVRSIRISPTKPGEPFEVRKATSTIKEVELAVAPVETGKVYQVIAKLTAVPKEPKAGMITGTITLETNLAGHPTVDIPVNVNVMRR